MGTHRRWPQDRRWRAITFTFLAMLGMPATGFAESALAPALSWVRESGAEGCASGSELARALESQLGRSVLVALPRAQLTIEGSIEPASVGFSAHFRVFDRAGALRGERAFVAPVAECRTLDSLLVFVLALLVDPDAPLLPPELPPGMSLATDSALAELFGMEPSVPPLALAAPGSEPATPTTNATAPPADAKPRDRLSADQTANARDGWHARANLDALAAVGLLPKPGSGLRLTVEALPFRVLRFELGGAFFLDNVLQSNTATFSALLVELAACYDAIDISRVLRLWACGRGSFGPLRTQVAADAPRDPVRTILQLGAGPTLEWELSEIVSLRVGLAASFPLLRDTFYLSSASGRTEVFRMSPVIASGALGLSAAIF